MKKFVLDPVNDLGWAPNNTRSHASQQKASDITPFISRELTRITRDLSSRETVDRLETAWRQINDAIEQTERNHFETPKSTNNDPSVRLNFLRPILAGRVLNSARQTALVALEYIPDDVLLKDLETCRQLIEERLTAKRVQTSLWELTIFGTRARTRTTPLVVVEPLSSTESPVKSSRENPEIAISAADGYLLGLLLLKQAGNTETYLLYFAIHQRIFAVHAPEQDDEAYLEEPNLPRGFSMRGR